jgi:hypothetical protein
MSSIPLDSSTVGTKADARAVADAPALAAPLARAALLYGLAIGVGADALMRDGPVGLGFFIWIALCGLALVGMISRAGHVVRRETVGWLGTAVLFAALTAWRNDEALQFFNVVSALVSLGIAATVAAGRPFASIFAARVRDFVEAALRMVADAVVGVLILVTRDRALVSGDHGTRRAYTIVRSIALTVPVLIVFLLLLRSADPVFASLVALPDWEFDVVMSHIVITGFFAWASAGWIRRAIAASNAAVRRSDSADEGQAPIAGIGITEITVLLASLGVLFALFVAVQVGWLFGGETMIRERTNLTIAQYARRGFFELVWVTLLIIPVLLATRTLLPAKPAERRRHSQLALPLVGLVALILVSALYRMNMYVSYFGLTTDRLFATVFTLWLGVVLAWLAWTVLRERGTPFVGGAVVAGLFGLAVLNVIDPNAIVARTNLSREPLAVSTPVPIEGQTGTDTLRYRGVDLAYLSRLTDGAVPLVIAAVEGAPAASPAGDASRTESRCAAARQIAFHQRHVTASQLAREAHWRTWNFGGSRERKLKSEHRKAMLDIVHSCPSAPPRTVSVPG